VAGNLVVDVAAFCCAGCGVEASSQPSNRENVETCTGPSCGLLGSFYCATGAKGYSAFRYTYSTTVSSLERPRSSRSLCYWGDFDFFRRFFRRRTPCFFIGKGFAWIAEAVALFVKW
jgi:hypothetical protein